MGNNVPLISSLRQPIRTLFLILLPGLISFAFISKAVEYLVVQRETGRLGSYYRSIGSLETMSGGETGDVAPGADLIRTSPYLAYEDRRQASSGVLRDLWNADISGSSSDRPGRPIEMMTGIHNSDMWFYGTLRSRREIVIQEGEETPEPLGYSLTFMVDKTLAGYPEYARVGSSLELLFLFAGQGDAIPAIEKMGVGQRYLIRGWKDILFQLDPSWENASSTWQIKALDDAQTWYVAAEEGAEIDFTDPALAGIKNEIDILNENQRALYLFGTSDMSAIPQMQETARLYYLVAGRWLNRQDDLEARRAIVIQRDFANLRKLALGDTLTMTLRGLQDPYAGYIRGRDREIWRSYPTYEATFEIVGIFDDLPGLSSTIHTTWAYVPNSVLPVDAVYRSDALYYGNYSFVLESSQYQERFISENRERLAQLGLGLTFVDNNGSAFWASVAPLRRSALAGVIVYGVVLLVALALVVFLYLNQRQKDYAILRVLGVPQKRADFQLSLPMLLIGAAGVIAGGVPAWKVALGKTAETFATLPTPAGELPSTSLNPLFLCALCAGVLLLLLGFTWAGIKIQASRPVLALLARTAPAGRTRQTASAAQPGAAPAYSARPEARTLDKAPSMPAPAGQQVEQQAAHGPARGAAHSGVLVRFSLRQIRRSGLKSLLTALTALGFMLALGWMQWSMDKNRAEVDRLYATTVIEAEIVEANSLLAASSGAGIISGRTIEAILESGFVHSAYTEAAAKFTEVVIPPGPAHKENGLLLAFDQPEPFFASLMERDTVQYAAGWDERLFTKTWDKNSIQRQGLPAVFPENLLNEYDLHLGDVLYLVEESGQVYPYLAAGQYTQLTRQYSGTIFKNMGEPVLLPLSALRAIQNNQLYFVTAKFVLDPAKNRELPAFREEVKKLVSASSAGRVPLQIVLWDEELRAVVEPLEKNLSLLEVLYPVTLAVSVLIGAGLCLLLALQQARDTALLRMLGVGKARVRAMLSSQQLLLSSLGVLLGLGLLAAVRQNPGALLAGPALVAAGLYLLGALVGSLIGAISVSNKQPLALLQVKE